MEEDSSSYINFNSSIVKDNGNGIDKLLNSSEAYDMLCKYFSKVTYGPGTNWEEVPDEIQFRLKPDPNNKGVYYYKPPLEKKLSLNDLRNVVYSFIEISKNETLCQKVSTSDRPLVVVGDVHGNEFLLNNLLMNYDIKNFNYLFLGDYIDRGSDSLSCIILVYLVKIFNPTNVLLRGNHELDIDFCDLERSLINHYKDKESMNDIMDLNKLIRTSFDYLTICAIVDDKYFCVHGGIPKEWSIVKCIYGKQKPIKIYMKPDDYKDSLLKDKDQHLLLQFLWNDVKEKTDSFFADDPDGFCSNTIRGGNFYLYPLKAVDKFLNDNNLVKIIRGHLPVTEGIKEVGNVITVHSTTYDFNSKGGFLIIFKGQINKNII